MTTVNQKPKHPMENSEAITTKIPQRSSTAGIVTDYARRECETCKRQFMAIVVTGVGGKKLWSRHCDLCVAADHQKTLEAYLATQPPTAEPKWALLCPREYRLTSESDGVTDMARLRRECPKLDEVLRWKFRPRGLLLRGATGRCKTRALWRLLRAEFDQGRPIIAMTAGEFGRQYATAGGEHRTEEWFRLLSVVPVFFIDEIGHAGWTDGAEATFFDLLEKRGVEGRPILAATNHNRVTLVEKLRDGVRAEPLIRRLGTYCEAISLDDEEALR